MREPVFGCHDKQHNAGVGEEESMSGEPIHYDDRTVIRPAEVLPSAPQAQQQQPVASARVIDDYPGNNRILAAAMPLLLLLCEDENAPPLADETCADALLQVLRNMENAGIAESERRAALLVLCETVDDIVLDRPGIDRNAWLCNGMTRRFFHRPSSGTGFFETLNRLFLSPDRHRDLLQLMDVCLALGFQGQYRAMHHQTAGLKQLRDDLHATLMLVRPGSPHADQPAHKDDAAPQRKWQAVPLWAVAAALAAIVATGFGTMYYSIERDGDAVAAELMALSPSGTVTIERLSPETPQ